MKLNPIPKGTNRTIGWGAISLPMAEIADVENKLNDLARIIHGGVDFLEVSGD
jgi:hypothetical protein